MTRTYKIEPHGKKFLTRCRVDGYASVTFTSKNTRAAKRKGDEFVSGERTGLRKYTTAYGRAINEAKSNRPRRVAVIAGGRPSLASLALAVASLEYEK
jgi:hypothetical protein